MKKNYIAPNSKVVKIRIMTNLMQTASIAGTTGLNHDITIGGTTPTADSRAVWDWDNIEY